MFIRRLTDMKVMTYCQFLKLSSHFLSSIRLFSQNTIYPHSRAEFRAMTAHVFRQEKSYKAVVQQVFSASESIKVLRLFVPDPGFYFKAGQWVDFYVPGIQDVTGYSMTSAPYEAKEKGILDLAIKNGKFPPTRWVHSECKGGDEVEIRVGGDFYYDPLPNTPAATADLILIGGGVGINPMVSIVAEYCHVLATQSNAHLGVSPGKLNLLYSAKTEDELIFKEMFTNLEAEHPTLSCQYFISNYAHQKFESSDIKYSRIHEQDIAEVVKQLQPSNTVCYVCGPSTMTDDVASILLKLGITKDYIKYEKWW